jgi:serine/threonine protein kinase
MDLLEQLIGQVLDEKYRVDRQLGEGGMGAVYLATHLGTGRPVALKVISPRFMANEEFVSRFKREAKAAGLLRHPNVVNVTDFGFADLAGTRVAYLVMEYLDGCTLSDVLGEEKRLPLGWVADIVEQVCLAIDRAHKQGIIHRDLKPDNIWLEPNERGGYTVKVLDFGLARVADAAPVGAHGDTRGLGSPALSYDIRATQIQGSAELDQAQMGRDERATVMAGSEQATIVAGAAPAAFANQPAPDTVLAKSLTQVGAVMGTPVYMSPEQCVGGHLDAASDIYSLGIIAYEMLAGEPPFLGDMGSLMAQHIESAPPPLRGKRPDVSKAVEELILSTLAKNPAHRPASAAAFAVALRARSERTGVILRKAFGLYSEHFPTFFRISLIAYIPALAVILLWIVGKLLDQGVPWLAAANNLVSSLLAGASQTFAWVINVGVFVPIVAQLLVAPLRPVEIRPAFEPLKKRLRPFIVATVYFYLLVAFLVIYLDSVQGLLGGIIGDVSLLNRSLEPVFVTTANSFIKQWLIINTAITVLFAVPAALALRAIVNYILYAPVIIMEGRSSRDAFLRSKELVRRSWRTVLKTLAIFLAIRIFEGAFSTLIEGQFVEGQSSLLSSILLGTTSRGITILLNILINPLIAVSLALLYFKARQTSGETLKEVLGDYQTKEVAHSKWQSRMLKRLNIRNSRASGV